jgi:hypothetical protein
MSPTFQPSRGVISANRSPALSWKTSRAAFIPNDLSSAASTMSLRRLRIALGCIRFRLIRTRVAHKVSGAPLGSIPLVLSLEWATAHPEINDRKLDGLELLQSLMAEVETLYRQGFSDRDSGAQAGEAPIAPPT